MLPWPPSLAHPFAAPALSLVLAALLASAGPLLLRRREEWWPVLSAAGVLAGWAALVPAPAAWLAPRSVAEHLPGGGAALLLGLAAATALPPGRSRRLALLAGFGVGAWWLAGAPAARGEYWRAFFAVAGVAALLRFRGGAAAAGLAVSALVLLLGTAAAVSGPAYWGIAAGLLGAAGAVALRQPGVVLAAGPAALGIVATALGAGGLPRGRVDATDLVCVAAVLAPRLRGPIERRMGRKPGRARRFAAGVLAAAGPAALCWAGGMLLRR